MISSASDYIAGAHAEIMQRLTETNLESLSGYGADTYSESAVQKIKRACGCPEADVYFLVGHADESGHHQHHAETLRGSDCGEYRPCKLS